MTAPRDPDRRIRAFLAEGRSELPDRAYDAVRASVDRTRQRAVIGPWREPDMSTIARLGSVAAVLVVAVIVGVGLNAGSGPGGGPTSPPSASPTPGSSPSASPSASPGSFSWPQALAPGAYSTSFMWDPFNVFRFTVADGWESRDIGIVKGDRMALQFYFVENVVTDPCGEALAEPPIGGSVDDLVTALSGLVSVTAGPQPVTVGDRDGVYLEYTVGPDLPCPASEFRLMKLMPGTCGEGCGGLGPPWIGSEFGQGEEHNRMWILQVGRGRAVINAVWTSKATSGDLADLQAVIDSMRYDTPSATAPPQPEPSSPSPNP